MNETPVSIRAAASTYHKSEKWVRGFVDAGKVRAFRAGGGKLPRLRVYMSELRAVIEAETIYTPPSKQSRKIPHKKPTSIHPAAAAM